MANQWGKVARDSAKNASGGHVNGKHRGKPVKGKGGLNKPDKGSRVAKDSLRDTRG